MKAKLTSNRFSAGTSPRGMNEGTVKSVFVAAACLLVATASTKAQGPPIALPGLNTGVSASAAVAIDELPVSDSASRFVSPEKLPEFLSKSLASFSIMSRKSDPFGQTQDPTAKPAIVKATVTNRRPTSMKATAFGDIIGKIQINTIRPSENLFLIGTRPFKLGDSFPLSFRGKKISVKVVGVSAKKIDFQNTESGEIASVKLSVMPAGMSSGNGDVSAPGMVVDDKAAPLQIEPISEF